MYVKIDEATLNRIIQIVLCFGIIVSPTKFTDTVMGDWNFVSSVCVQ